MAKKVKEKSNMSKAIEIAKKVWFVLFNLVYAGSFIAYAIYSFYNKNQAFTWLPYVLIAVALIYFGSFIFIICQKDDKKMENDVKNYKASLKVFKKVLKLAGLVLSVLMLTNTFMASEKDLFSFGLAMATIPVVVFQIIMSIRKIIKKDKQRKVKAEKVELKNEFVSDIKDMVIADDEEEQVAEINDEEAYEVEEPEEKVKGKQAVINKAKKVATKTVNSAVKTAQNADKVAKRVSQYKEDKKNVGKKKK